MQSFDEMKCSECQSEFKSAASLLQHFALHASNSLKDEIRKKLPDLRPIVRPLRTEESDSGVEDVNPIKYCRVTMGEDAKEKKYHCSYCQKSFGWPTDLKRHIMTHTGERPFQCQICGASFTRNFLLVNHQKRGHNKVTRVPDLKPIQVKK